LKKGANKQLFIGLLLGVTMKEEALAKKEMLKELKKLMSKDDDMGLTDALKGKEKKVIVSSNSKKGLEEGLDKAKEILSKRKEMLGIGDMLDSEEEVEKEDELEEKEEDASGLEDKIAKLEEELAQLKSKK
jgi:hypothetical protein